MVKAEILVGIAASRRRNPKLKFVAGQMSEFCLYLRVDGVEVFEFTYFAPHWQILSFLNDDLCGHALSVKKDLASYIRYNYGGNFSSTVCEFTIRNGWRNRFETGQDVRCQPLPIEAIDALRAKLTSLGIKEAKS